MRNCKNILAKNVDIPLLRKQRNGLLKLRDNCHNEHNDTLDGVINMLDDMLDIAEGHA